MKKFLLFIFTLFVFSSSALAVDINGATLEGLQSVKGIGPGKAKAIIEYRQVNGPFKSVDDLKNVKGFSAKSVDKVKGELTVGAKSKKSDKAATPATPAIGARGDKSAHEPATRASPAIPADKPEKGKNK
jgi:competence protein ComEA